ncbi:MAG: hypothetical protein ABIA63_02105 [bacterium]
MTVFLIIMLSLGIMFIVVMSLREGEKNSDFLPEAIKKYKNSIQAPSELYGMTEERWRELQTRGARITQSEYRRWHFCNSYSGQLKHMKSGKCICGYQPR